MRRECEEGRPVGPGSRGCSVVLTVRVFDSFCLSTVLSVCTDVLFSLVPSDPVLPVHMLCGPRRFRSFTTDVVLGPCFSGDHCLVFRCRELSETTLRISVFSYSSRVLLRNIFLLSFPFFFFVWTVYIPRNPSFQRRELNASYPKFYGLIFGDISWVIGSSPDYVANVHVDDLSVIDSSFGRRW